MNKAQIQQIVVVVLLLLLTVIWAGPHLTSLMSGSNLGGTSVLPPPADPTQVRKAQALTQEPVENEEITIVSRDPFQVSNELREAIRAREQANEPTENPNSVSKSQPSAPVELPPLTLQGIFMGGTHPQAIINRQVVSDGDLIGEVKVVKITKEGVTVSFGGKEFQVEFPKKISGGDRSFGLSS